MTRLTKEQIEKLTPSQQEELGRMELRRVQHHQDLLKRARGSRNAMTLVALAIYLVGGTSLLRFADGDQLGPFYLIFFLTFALICYIAGFLTRRMDALLALYETTLKEEPHADR